MRATILKHRQQGNQETSIQQEEGKERKAAVPRLRTSIMIFSCSTEPKNDAQRDYFQPVSTLQSSFNGDQPALPLI
jgi:hypothetical protein